jgi:hypothetical protein
MDRPFARGEIGDGGQHANTEHDQTALHIDLQYGLVQCGQGFEKMIGAAGRRKVPGSLRPLSAGFFTTR